MKPLKTTKTKIYFALTILFSTLAIIGGLAGVLSGGSINPGYGLIPLLWALIFGEFLRRSRAEEDKNDKEK